MMKVLIGVVIVAFIVIALCFAFSATVLLTSCITRRPKDEWEQEVEDMEQIRYLKQWAKIQECKERRKA